MQAQGPVGSSSGSGSASTLQKIASEVSAHSAHVISGGRLSQDDPGKSCSTPVVAFVQAQLLVVALQAHACDGLGVAVAVAVAVVVVTVVGDGSSRGRIAAATRAGRRTTIKERRIVVAVGGEGEFLAVTID